MEQHDPIVVEVWRGETIESRHEVVAAVADADGAVRECYGNADFVTYWRSAAKPFQSQPWVTGGVLENFGWGDEQLAIMCASHAGTPLHADLIRTMLADIGLTEAALLCDHELKARHNCSGNHLGFLAASVFHSWDLATYQQPKHPAQQAALAAFAEAVRLPPEAIPVGVDGCGIVTYATAITVIAQAWARLPQLLPRQAAAMRAHPLLVAGEGKLDTVMMRAFPGLVSKRGAEGLGCAALADGRGVAVKALDGGSRATDPALVALVTRCLGMTEMPPATQGVGQPSNTNDVGRVVGRLVAVLPH
ncbi:MAG: asparaginase [Thermoleophilia bacterium]